MKKIFNYALIGAMVVASQSMVFANTGDMKQLTKATTMGEVIKATMISKATKDMEVIPAVAIMPMQPLTPEMEAELKEERMKFEQEKIAEICKVLDLDGKSMKDKSLNEVLEGLTEAQNNKLIESGIIVIAATLTPSVEATESIPATKIEK